MTFVLPHFRPKSGSLLLYSRKKVRYRRDGYCWKKRKDGKTTREDHMKLKVQGTEVSSDTYLSWSRAISGCTIRQLAGIVFQPLPSFVKGLKKGTSISRLPWSSLFFFVFRSWPYGGSFGWVMISRRKLTETYGVLPLFLEAIRPWQVFAQGCVQRRRCLLMK